MTTAKAPNGDETHLRAIVYREGDIYVAQCLEYDIATQAPELDLVIDRLELTIQEEFAACEAAGKVTRDLINPAPNYYQSLWDKREFSLHRINVSSPECGQTLEVGLARAA